MTTVFLENWFSAWAEGTFHLRLLSYVKVEKESIWILSWWKSCTLQPGDRKWKSGWTFHNLGSFLVLATCLLRRVFKLCKDDKITYISHLHNNHLKYRKCLNVHSVRTNFCLNVHGVCTNLGLNVHSPCLLCNPIECGKGMYKFVYYA